MEQPLSWLLFCLPLVVAVPATAQHTSYPKWPPHTVHPTGFPAVPRMAPAQIRAIKEISKHAHIASARATPALLALLDSDALRDKLRRCCSSSGIAQWSAAELLTELRANFYSAELMHSFDGEVNIWDTDMTVSIGLHNASYFGNAWMLRFLGYGRDPTSSFYGHPRSPNDAAEEGIFKLEPFSGRYDLPTTYAAAHARLNYVTLNMLRLDKHPSFGNVSAVFSPSYWRDAVAASPVDSGYATEECNQTYRNTPHAGIVGTDYFACNTSNVTAGVAGAIDHVLLSNALLWSKSRDTLAAMFARWYGDGEAWTNITDAGAEAYIEADVLATVHYDAHGVKLLIGSLPVLFGTQKGLELQMWAIREKIALAWALGNGMRFIANSSDAFRGDQRLLDGMVAPYVNLNLNIPPSSVPGFYQIWHAAQSLRNASSDGNLSEHQAWTIWAQLQQQFGPLMLSIPAPGDCQDWNLCLGVGGSNDTRSSDNPCICYNS